MEGPVLCGQVQAGGHRGWGWQGAAVPDVRGGAVLGHAVLLPGMPQLDVVLPVPLRPLRQRPHQLRQVYKCTAVTLYKLALKYEAFWYKIFSLRTPCGVERCLFVRGRRPPTFLLCKHVVLCKVVVQLVGLFAWCDCFLLVSRHGLLAFHMPGRIGVCLSPPPLSSHHTLTTYSDHRTPMIDTSRYSVQ